MYESGSMMPALVSTCGAKTTATQRGERVRGAGGGDEGAGDTVGFVFGYGRHHLFNGGRGEGA
jgi:hypothetical protein